MGFEKGNIICYCGELYVVESNFGDSGTVFEVDSYYKRSSGLITNFRWDAYGEKCKLIKSKLSIELEDNNY